MNSMTDWSALIGQKVRKTSGHPFKSGSKINTVKGVIDHPQLPGKPAFTFEEDDSYVRTSICKFEPFQTYEKQTTH